MLSITWDFDQQLLERDSGYPGAYDGVTQSSRSEPSDDLLDFVGVNANAIECAWLRKLAVRSCGQVLRVTSKIQVSQPTLSRISCDFAFGNIGLVSIRGRNNCHLQ